MDEILQYPKVDPHGEPIPDKEGNIIAQDLIKLSQCQPGKTYVFSAVTISDDDFLLFK
jgi:DtxR family Mn-dependent transcriptional regulator